MRAANVTGDLEVRGVSWGSGHPGGHCADLAQWWHARVPHPPTSDHRMLLVLQVLAFSSPASSLVSPGTCLAACTGAVEAEGPAVSQPASRGDNV